MAEVSRWYRIQELTRLSGVSRRNVHFYIEEGLLHPPRRTGRTMAYYDDVHLAELAHIRQARESGTPLFAIRHELAQHFGARPSRGAKPEATGPKSRTARRKRAPGQHDVREKILTLGCKLFLQKGLAATAVSDITARLDVGKGTFYAHFADKEQLFLECAPRIFQALFAPSWDRIRREHHPLRRLELRAEAVLPALAQLCAMLALCREAQKSSDRKLRDMGRRTLASIRQPIEDDLRRGLELGLIRPLDPSLTSVMLVGLVESLQYLDAAGLRPSPMDLRQALARLILSGIRGAP